MLGKLFGRFSEDLAKKSVILPAVELEDDAYFKALAGVALAPEGLPDNLMETLYAIEEMANEEGQERLEAAARQAGLDLVFDEQSSPGDIAVQVFLAQPELLAEKHNEQRMTRLASFEYYGRKKPVERSGSGPDGPPFSTPGQPVLELLVADLDAWFKEHNRGEQTASIEVYGIEGEWWFLVRHGDTFARTVKVEKKKTEMLHFRPAKDDVVVYSPERDELRIHAGTKGERDLYRIAFGIRLMGDGEYFSERKAYTLKPLREEGVNALSVEGIEGIQGIVLCELEVAWGGDYEEVAIRKANDVFGAASARNREAIPAGGRLVRAVFEFTFQDSKKPRKVQIRPPNVLKFGRHSDARLVNRWLSAAGFRVNAREETEGPRGQVAALAGA